MKPHKPSCRTGLLPLLLLLVAIGVYVASSRGGTPDVGEPYGTRQTTGQSTGAGTQSALVERVVDGDTFIAQVEGRRERIRLIGIDAPEMPGENKSGEPFAQEAWDRLAGLVEAQTVHLTMDTSDRDSYDRLLRYVYLEDGTFVNRQLALEGLADVKSYPPDTALQPLLEEAERDAKASGLGIWSD